jgi:hypothetical protein
MPRCVNQTARQKATAAIQKLMNSPLVAIALEIFLELTLQSEPERLA